MSERGPKGDHGQHGDLGPTGPTGTQGERGAHGETGQTGERGVHGDIGQAGQTGRRGQRGPSHWIAYALMGVFVIIGFWLFQGQVDKIDHLARANRNTALAAKTAAAKANRAIAQIARESRERRDQSCLRDEREHLRDVNQLRRTYAYLKALPAAERQSTLNQTILRQLPQTERETRDRAPQFCDEPAIGLPEPDPVIPKRPKSLR